MKGKIFLIIFLLALIGLLYYLTFGYFSKGERAGTISKLSERGYVFKTNEGVLNEGGYSGETGTLTPRYWDFSTSADTVVVKLKEALNTGERVTLIYQEKFFRFPWNGDTKYFIVDVKFLHPRGNQERETILERQPQLPAAAGPIENQIDTSAQIPPPPPPQIKKTEELEPAVKKEVL